MKESCFYIPNITLMHVKLNDTVKSLCFGITRGYFETVTLSAMLSIIDAIEKTDIKLIDNIDKVKLKDGRLVYRQRVYFVCFEDVATLCRKLDLGFDLTDDIYLTPNSYETIKKEMSYLEVYASQLHFSVDEWLIAVFRYYCFVYIKEKDMLDLSSIDDDFFAEIETKKGLLNRAPYFLSICDIAKNKYVILQYYNVEDEHLYTIEGQGTFSIFNYGFTNLTLIQDKKKGIIGKR